MQCKLGIRIALVAVILLPLARSALAVEGGIGRPISGASINPYAGLIPPAPGLTLAIAEQYYTGPISGAVPIGNFNLNLGLDMKASFTPVSIVYIWPTPWKEVNFASVVAFPITYIEVKARVTLGPLTRETKDHNFGLFDLFFTPVIASYHITKTDHIALSFSLWAPTGDYDPNRLAVLSTNTWTFVPSLAYTKIFPAANIELSGYWGLTFDTENSATHYQNGVLSDLEGTAIKRFKFGGGLGVIGSWIQQLNDDTGQPPTEFTALAVAPLEWDRSSPIRRKSQSTTLISTRAGCMNLRTANAPRVILSHSAGALHFNAGIKQ